LKVKSLKVKITVSGLELRGNYGIF